MLDNRLNVEHRVIRNSEDPYPYAGDSPVARLVVLPLLLMHAAIELDRQFGGVAVKVGDVPIDHLLTAEMKPVECISAKGLPKSALRRSHFAAQLFGEPKF